MTDINGLWFIVGTFLVLYIYSEPVTMSQIREIRKEIDKIYEVLAK